MSVRLFSVICAVSFKMGDNAIEMYIEKHARMLLFFLFELFPHSFIGTHKGKRYPSYFNISNGYFYVKSIQFWKLPQLKCLIF